LVNFVLAKPDFVPRKASFVLNWVVWLGFWLYLYYVVKLGYRAGAQKVLSHFVLAKRHFVAGKQGFIKWAAWLPVNRFGGIGATGCVWGCWCIFQNPNAELADSISTN
jgi:hypothetical protein